MNKQEVLREIERAYENITLTRNKAIDAHANLRVTIAATYGYIAGIGYASGILSVDRDGIVTAPANWDALLTNLTGEWRDASKGMP